MVEIIATGLMTVAILTGLLLIDRSVQIKMPRVRHSRFEHDRRTLPLRALLAKYGERRVTEEWWKRAKIEPEDRVTDQAYLAALEHRVLEERSPVEWEHSSGCNYCSLARTRSMYDHENRKIVGKARAKGGYIKPVVSLRDRRDRTLYTWSKYMPTEGDVDAFETCLRNKGYKVSIDRHEVWCDEGLKRVVLEMTGEDSLKPGLVVALEDVVDTLARKVSGGMAW